MAIYKHLMPDFGSGYNNMGGTGSLAFFAPIGDFLALQTPAVSPVAPEDKYVVATAHTFNTTKKFLKLYTSSEKGRLKYEAVGGQDGGGYKVMFSAFVPGDSKDINYAANELRSDWLIFIVKDTDGFANQVGTADHKPSIKLTKDTENIGGDGKGYMIEVECYMPFKLIYTGAISTTAAA